MSQDALIDRIYEAAVVPDLWQSVIEVTAKETGCFGGSLFTTGQRGTMISASKNCEEHLRALLEGGWADTNIRAQRVVSKAHIGFVIDEDICSSEEIASHPIYTNFLRPRGLGWSAATHISGASDDIAIFCIDQSYSEGPVSREVRKHLDSMRPHIARAAMLSAQVYMDRLQTTLTSMDTIGVPAAAVDRTGQVRQANQSFQAATAYANIGAFNKLELRDNYANVLFREALLAQNVELTPRSIAIAGDDGTLPCVLHLIPVRRQARDVFSKADVLVALVPLNSPGLVFSDVMRKLYDLTQAEARAAEALVSGYNANEMAKLHGINVETARTHIKRLLSKTGVKRQSEFILRFSTYAFLKP